MATDKYSQMAVRLKPLENSKHVTISYLNINSIRNKFDGVEETLVNYVDVFIAAETKIN